jgi:hypothetical protein
MTIFYMIGPLECQIFAARNSRAARVLFAADRAAPAQYSLSAPV